MKATTDQRHLSQIKADAWVLFHFKGKPALSSPKNAAERELSRMVTSWLKPDARKRATAAIFPCWDKLPTKNVILVNLGKESDLHFAKLESATAAAARLAVASDCSKVALAAKTLRKHAKEMATVPMVRALVQGAALGPYTLGGKNKPAQLQLILAEIKKTDRDYIGAVRDGAAIGDALNAVRDLANSPGNVATPAAITTAARSLARKYGLACTVLNRKQLKQKKCEALLSVANGSGGDGRLIILRHGPQNSKKRPIVLIGKTITFDTGGISLKPAKTMEWMKFDKCGGMGVLAAIVMLAKLKSKHPVIAMLPTAENMPDAKATRPGDVIRSHSGKTIEIINTDAEGRLVLADALSLAGEYKPRAIVDLATLTGAAVVATGNVVSPVMGNHDDLIAELIEAGDRCGDRVWPFPLLPEYSRALATPFADVKNTGDGTAGCIAAGAFLEHFVPPGVPWAHVDIAGTAWREKNAPNGSAGVTLFGAKLLCEWVQSLD